MLNYANKILFLTLGLALVTGCQKTYEQKASELQGILDRAAGADGVAPGTEIYVQAGQETWNLAGGLGNVDPATPMRADDKFRAGSNVKPFIATVILQMVEEGSLSLDTTLSSVLPAETISGFLYREQITVRMLLNHTSGVPEFLSDAVHAEIFANPTRIWTEQDWLDLAAAANQAQPGTLPGKYSNTDYVLLGLIIDAVSGHSWREEVRTRVIQPLGLANTSLPEPGDTTIPGDFAHGYVGTVDATAVDPSMAGAAGGSALVTNAADLHRFLKALLAGELFQSRSTLDAMQTWVEGDTDFPGVAHYYGLGLEKRVLVESGLELIGHGGSTAGYAATMVYFPASDIFVVAAATQQDEGGVYIQLTVPAYDAVK